VCHILTYRKFSVQVIVFLFFFLPFYVYIVTVAAIFCSSWDECPTNLWTLPVFSDFPNMAPNDLVQPVAAAVTSQVKLCPYNKEEPHIWCRLIEAQFAAAGIKSQKLNYANALPSLPKQVLRDILDTLDVCNDSDHPFDLLKEVLLGQFGKSKWQSYFELLWLPMDMQGLKPSILMGKLKQHLPPGVSPDTDLFLAMFLIRLPPSMREAVGAGHHKTAADTVRAGTPCGTLEAATTPRSRPPRLTEVGAPLPPAGR
jgi:hypothetical protein